MQMKQQVKEQFNHFLSRKHLKTTLQRNLVVDAMVELDRHTHVDELYLLLRAKHPYIGHATVYRALRLLAESGLVREINLGDGITRYRLARQGERRDYLVCSDCGGVTEFENGLVEKEQLKRAHSLGFMVESFKIELKGLCRHCQGRNSRTH
ncbi:Fur family transcriptional regulator [Geoanaerobacter pelophilus]|nr:transcriptional repressor [Geoanaerobacter pelophilus]